MNFLLYKLFTSSFLHCSSGIAPQKPQGSPSLLKLELTLAQVLSNRPPFLKIIFTAIPKTPKASKPITKRANFMLMIFFANLGLKSFVNRKER